MNLRWVVKFLSHSHHAAIVLVWASSREAAKQRVRDAKIAVKVYGAEEERK
jgi:hypothetical protein